MLDRRSSFNPKLENMLLLQTSFELDTAQNSSLSVKVSRNRQAGRCRMKKTLKKGAVPCILVYGWVGKYRFSFTVVPFSAQAVSHTSVLQKNTSPPLFFLKAISQLQLNRGDRCCFETESMTRSFSDWIRNEFTNRTFPVR
jgi:hypothetical protein